jgi:Protein of unknown function (DUF3500)
MPEGTRVFHVRNRHSTPALAPFKLPPLLQGMLDRGQANMAAPFKGLTADGTAAPGLFRLERTGQSLQPLVEAAKSYLAALDPQQRTASRFEIDAREWQGWSNIHPFLMRHGVCLADLTGEQRKKALALLMETMSAYGYKLSRDVMKLNGHVLEYTPLANEYGEWLYWVSIMGGPSATEPWGWQIDGHHLIVNCFVIGDQMVMTPTFMGSEPVYAPSGPYAGTRVFGEEERNGFVLMGALSPEQRAKATIGEKLPLDVTSAFRDNEVMPYQGIRYGDLDKGQRELLERLIGLYTGCIRPGHAEIRYDEVKRRFDDTWFAWVGRHDDESPFYYRVHSPVILIEFDHQSGIVFDNNEPTRNHIHTVVRTPNGNDYGKDLLRLHYAQHDHNDPHSPHRQGKA